MAWSSTSSTIAEFSLVVAKPSIGKSFIIVHPITTGLAA
jgi:hypothetical protein